MITTWLSIGLPVLVALPGGWYGWVQMRRATRADQERSAEALIKKINDARAEERSRLADRIADLTNERDYERRRADDLQNLINQWRLDRTERGE